MINKKMMSYIKRELKNKNEIIILYKATKEEKEYLLQRDIFIEKVIVYHKGLIYDKSVPYEYYKYTKIN